MLTFRGGLVPRLALLPWAPITDILCLTVKNDTTFKKRHLSISWPGEFSIQIINLNTFISIIFDRNPSHV